MCITFCVLKEVRNTVQYISSLLLHWAFLFKNSTSVCWQKLLKMRSRDRYFFLSGICAFISLHRWTRSVLGHAYFFPSTNFFTCSVKSITALLALVNTSFFSRSLFKRSLYNSSIFEVCSRIFSMGLKFGLHIIPVE